MAENNNGSKVAIIVAIIGCVGTILAAVINQSKSSSGSTTNTNQTTTANSTSILNLDNDFCGSLNRILSSAKNDFEDYKGARQSQSTISSSYAVKDIVSSHSCNIIDSGPEFCFSIELYTGADSDIAIATYQKYLQMSECIVTQLQQIHSSRTSKYFLYNSNIEVDIEVFFNSARWIDAVMMIRKKKTH